MNKFIPQMEPWFDEKEVNAMASYMRTDGWYTEFKKTEELEKMIADFVGAKYCVMTVNGTVSLILALLASGLKNGDEVLVPDVTMIATPNSANLLGLKPVFIDLDKNNYCMDIKKTEQAITPKTKAVIYVSLNGRSGDMNKVKELCKKYKLFFIEDAAQSLGSYWNGKHLGNFGEIGTLSFAVPKIITMGQGGALLTDNIELYKKIKSLKNFGRARGGIDIHDEMGWNFKFTDLQAVVGIEQMKKLNFRIKRKKEIYKRYAEGLRKLKDISLPTTNIAKTTPWAIDIFVNKPDDLALYLKKNSIGTRRVYPAIHTQKIYRNYRGNFPISIKYASTGLWLPSSTQLKDKEIDYIIKKIRNYFD